MKNRNQKGFARDKYGKIIASLIGVSIIIPAVYAVKELHEYKKGYDAVPDKTTNINVALKRPDNWYQIDISDAVSQMSPDVLKIIDGSTATVPITAELTRQLFNISDEELNKNYYKYINHNTTGKAYQNLIQGSSKDGDECHLLFATEPSDEELAEAEENNVKLIVEPVALDGFVFIVNKDNPVDSLTVSQIQDIYSGKITNWKEVGGKNCKITAFQRERNSGSQTAMENLVMKDKKLMEATEKWYVQTMSLLIENVAEYNNSKESIGYTYNYYINNLYKNDNIKVLKIDGITVDKENLISGAYPFTTSYNIVTRDDETKAEVSMIHDFILSDKGQEMIELAGYCPVR